MASYATKYLFKFEAKNGDEMTIQIEKDGYSGAIIQRALGGAPILRRERNGHVCGTSLEFLAECLTDGEFAEFYTSDPKMFRVTLNNSNNNVPPLFQGFISPELYAEPDIAPPYDVKVIATDGLGELRRYEYEPQGQIMLYLLIEYLLSFTGLKTDFFSNNSTLVGGQTEIVPAADFFDSTYINVDHLAGKTCYDVLTYILDSINADLFQHCSWGLQQWQILRETDVEDDTEVVFDRSKVDPAVDQKVQLTGFGSMQNYYWWPIGRIESEVKPACRRQVIKTDANYKEGFVNADMTYSGGWSVSNASYDSTLGAYKITSQNGLISQRLDFAEAVQRRLKLKVFLRQYRSTSGTGSASTAQIIVNIYGRAYGGGLTYRYLTKDADGNLVWSTSYDSIDVDLPAPVYGQTEDACTVVELEIPLYNEGARSHVNANWIDVGIRRDSSNQILLIHSASLTMAEQIAGYQDTVIFDNGAREDAEEVNSLFLPAVSGRYGTPVEFMYSVPKIISSGSFVPIDLFTPIAGDYARSNGVNRLIKRGRLNVPPGENIPFAFMYEDNAVYLIRTFEWDLFNCEMTVELLSLPAVSVSIAEQKVEELVYKGGSGSSSGGSSSGGGGGGGGGTVTSVGLEMPTGFLVSQSPVTSSGTLKVQMADGYSVPTNTKQGQWDEAYGSKHSHSNKSVLDDISEFSVQDWDSAYAYSHVHSNKSILDAITLNDVAFLRKKMQALILVPPTVKRFRLQANTTSLSQEQPCFFVSHPLIAIENLSAEVCLMVYRKRNGGGGTRKAHRKGWFLACGNGHAAAAAYTAYIAPETGLISHLLPEADLLNGIAKTYLQIRNNAIPFSSYADWLTAVANVSAYGDFGFAGWYQAENLKKKIHFGLAIRIENPAFQTYVDPDPGIELLPDTGSIQGVPRYLYSAVAPLTARMYDRNTAGAEKGKVVFELL